MEMHCMGFAEIQLREKDGGWLKSWLMSDAGNGMLGFVMVVAVAVALAI